MATVKTPTCKGTKPARVPGGSEVVNARENLAVLAAEIAVNNVLQMLVLPANCVPIDYVLDMTDLDTGTPALAVDLGILDSTGLLISTAAADGGDEWIDNSVLGQAGGIALSTATAALYRVLKAITPVNYDRIVAVVVKTAAGTAAAGNVALEMSYRAA